MNTCPDVLIVLLGFEEKMHNVIVPVYLIL